MIVHMVCWKYKSGIDAATREAHIRSLEALKFVIRDVRSLRVGADIMSLDRSFDTGLVAEFADRGSLDRYTDHPDHQRAAAFGREISEKVVSVDFLDTSDDEQ